MLVFLRPPAHGLDSDRSELREWERGLFPSKQRPGNFTAVKLTASSPHIYGRYLQGGRRITVEGCRRGELLVAP